jgi:hypothetical protein
LPEPKASSIQAVVTMTAIVGSARSIYLGSGPAFIPFSAPESVVQTIIQRLPAVFSPDGKVLAIVRYNRSWAGDYEIVLHDMTTGKDTVIPCQGRSISFSPDGKTLVAVGSFGVSESERLLDLSTGKWIKPSGK